MQHFIVILFDACTILAPSIFMTLIYDGILARQQEGLRLPQCRRVLIHATVSSVVRFRRLVRLGRKRRRVRTR